MGIGPRRNTERHAAEHRLEKAMDMVRASKSERVIGRRLFATLADSPDRPAYDQIVDKAMAGLERSRKAEADAAAATA